MTHDSEYRRLLQQRHEQAMRRSHLRMCADRDDLLATYSDARAYGLSPVEANDMVVDKLCEWLLR